MLRPKLWSLLAAVFLVSSLSIFVAPPVRTASAAAALTSIDPVSGPVGTSVRVIGTVGASADFQIWWHADSVAGGGSLRASGRANVLGTVNRLVTVPASEGGAHSIFLVEVGVVPSVSLSFTVERSITLSPTSGPTGRIVSIIGTGFSDADDGSVVVDFDGATLATNPVQGSLNVNAAGSWNATFTVPVVATGGAHTVTATAASGPASATFTTPGITITPPAGPPGTVVTVDGVGFQPNETGIRIAYDGVAITSTPATITADAAGEWSGTFAVPTAGVGTVHSVDAFGATTTITQVIGDNFTITAGISVSPPSGPAGTTVTVRGTGFGANEPGIALTFDGALVTAAFSANAAGTWLKTFVVPAKPSAGYNVVATGTAGDTQVFTVTPNLTISPASGAPGVTAVTVTGTGFQSSETGIVITFDTVPVATSPLAPVANTVGSWSATFVVPPLASGGSHTVDASGAITLAADVPDQTFNVRGITITPDTGPVGTTMTVNGAGFAASETGIQVTWDGTAIKTGITANASGSWTTTAVVPAAARGAHNVGAFGATTTAASVPARTFTVIPKISLTGTVTRPGETVTVTGTGFGAAETGIALTWDGVVEINAGTADANGGWTATLTIPNSSNGDHIVDAFGVSTPATTVSNVAVSVLHSLSISPASGNAGTVISVNGSGFFANETAIQVLMNGSVVKSGISADSKGSWSTTFTLGATPRSDRTITASGSTTTTSQVPGKTFTVQPGASLVPAAGFSGIAVNFTGDGFAAGSTISVTFDGTAVTTTPATITSSATGNISGSFTVPVATSGAHTLALNDGQGATEVTFTITSSVSATTTSATVGQSAGLSGEGFPPNSNVTFSFDGAALTTDPPAVTTDGSGAFAANVVVPEAARGPHTIEVRSGSAVITLGMEVTPQISLTPNSGTVGTTMTVSGKGFGAGEPISIVLDNSSLTTIPAAVTASASGAFSTSFAVPAVPGGAHAVKASDSSASAEANVNVTPGATATSTSAKVGDKVTVNAAGFPGNAAVSVTIDGVPASPSTVTASSNGTAVVDVTVPAGAAGSHTIALRSGTATAEAHYSISPSLSISPDNGNVGSIVTISGSGYAANSAVTITYEGNSITSTPSPLSANATGGFQTTIVVPGSSKGARDIAASDASANTVHATFTMESVPPQTPQLLTPANGSRLGTFGSVRPAFTWTPVSDPSGVTYTLEVSRDFSFASPEIQQAGLNESEFEATDTDKLGRGAYYWRVKAIDNASNESAYSTVSTLRVGILPTWMPTWMFIAFIVIGLGIIAGVVYLLAFAKGTNRTL